MSNDQRSGCPINLTLEVVGDRWSLLIIRDMIFGNRRHFRELLLNSEEGIASNILADRLKKMEAAGLIGAEPYQERPLRHKYVLTEKGRDLGEVLASLAKWGKKHVRGTIVAPEFRRKR